MRKRYQPNLSHFISCCEVNFVKLLKLLPADLSFEELDFNVDQMRLQITKIESARYTLTLKITKRMLSTLGDVKPCSMVVRLYFDAKMAEVVKYQGDKKIEPVYSYPNKKMLQRNEKQQANEFLGEWLTFYLSQGYFSDKHQAVLPKDYSS